MPSSSQNLTTNLIINAKAGSGFAELGNTLTQMASMVQGITGKIIDFGKDSLETYKNYEKNMADAQIALATTYGRGSVELGRVMRDLNKQAAEWAATTPFSTDEVSSAITEAARAGWDYKNIIEGIPASMELARAGGIDLSSALDYVIKSANAAKIPFDDLGSFIDHWAFAANSSATNIDELGQAMLRMGGTMNFAGDQDEVLAMLATLANNGYTGAQAGTLLRNAMLRLVAPTDKAGKIMGQMGATTEELSEIMSDTDAAMASAILTEKGFSAYDSDGNLRGMVDLFSELSVIMGSLTEEERNQVLSGIFPTRTISGAIPLIEDATGAMKDLYEALTGGEAEGYGSWAAWVEDNTLAGGLKLTLAKIEEMQRRTGSVLAPQAESFLNTFSGFIDKINGMDDRGFAGLVGSLEGFAGTGMALTGAASGIRLLAWAVGGWDNALALAAAISIGALVGALTNMSQVDYENSFGLMDLDTTAIGAKLTEIETTFDGHVEKVSEYQQAFTDASSAYTNMVQQLSGELIASDITGEGLDPQQLSDLQKLGEQVGGALKTGIQSGFATTRQSIAADYAAAGADSAEDVDAMSTIISAITAHEDELIAKAEGLSQQLSEALNGPFDGMAERVSSILSEMSELMEQSARRTAAYEMGRALAMAQGVSYDSYTEVMGMIDEAERNTLAEYSGVQAAALEEAKAALDARVASGEITAEKARASLENKKAAQAEAMRKYKYPFDAMRLNATADVIASNNPEEWAAISAFVQGGGGTPTSAQYGALKDDNIFRTLGEFVNQVGGLGAVRDMAETFRDNGQLVDAAQMNLVADAFNYMSQVKSGDIKMPKGYSGTVPYESLDNLALMGAAPLTAEETQETPDVLAGRRFFWDAMGSPITDLANIVGTPFKDLFSLIASSAEGAGERPDVGPAGWDNDGMRGAGADLSGAAAELSGAASTMQAASAVTEDMIAAYGGYENALVMAGMGGTTQEIVPQTQQGQATIEVQTFTASSGATIEGLEDQTVEVGVDANTASAEGAIDGLDGQDLTEFVDGDTAALASAIDEQDGRDISVDVGGNTAPLASAINSLRGQTITVNVVARTSGTFGRNQIGYAEGGRATQASIFGEAGPEWAIPEAHTERTAELLNAAREASGFTWPDLLARFGGLNANPQNSQTTLVYSPTINANDASGVDAVLRADKERLEQWYEDRKLHDRVEVYQ